MPKDRITNLHQSYGFVEFKSEEDADYAIKILNMCKLFGKPIRVNKSAQDRNSQDVGANLFVGNLDPDVDEKVSGGAGAAVGHCHLCLWESAQPSLPPAPPRPALPCPPAQTCPSANATHPLPHAATVRHV